MKRLLLLLFLAAAPLCVAQDQALPPSVDALDIYPCKDQTRVQSGICYEYTYVYAGAMRTRQTEAPTFWQPQRVKQKVVELIVQELAQPPVPAVTHPGPPAVTPPQAVQPYAGPLKDKGLAVLYSIIAPGAGHIYAGQTEMGAVLMVAYAASLIGGYALTDFETTCTSEGENLNISVSCSTNMTPFYVGLALAGIVQVIGIIDAPSAVEKYNEGLQLGQAQATATPFVTQHGTIGARLTLRW